MEIHKLPWAYHFCLNIVGNIYLVAPHIVHKCHVGNKASLAVAQYRKIDVIIGRVRNERIAETYNLTGNWEIPQLVLQFLQSKI